MLEQPKLSPWEYITLVGALSKIVTVTLGTTVTALFRGRSGAPSYKNHVIYQALRTYLGSLTTRQLQVIAPPTSKAYEAYMKSKKLTPQVVDIGDTVGCWIGNQKAEHVLLWLHGGGYAMNGATGHMIFLHALAEGASKQGKSLAILLLQYDVAPGAQFPAQLVQAVAAIEYLTKNVGVKPSQLLIGGDSAGGHLTLSVLSHILHPRSDVPALSLADQKLAGVLLVSPWVTFDQTAPAFKANAKKDILNGHALKTWSDAFVGGAPRDNYTYPLDAATEWWEGLPVEQTLVLTGGDEVFVDDIKAFAEKLKKHNSQVELYVGEGDPHDAPLMEGMTGASAGNVTHKLNDWALARL